jgi:hypothetical protein
MTAPVSVSCSKQTKSLTQTGLRSISGIGTDRRASIEESSPGPGFRIPVAMPTYRYLSVLDECIGDLALVEIEQLLDSLD